MSDADTTSESLLRLAAYEAEEQTATLHAIRDLLDERLPGHPITQYVTVNNPVSEPATRAQQRAMADHAAREAGVDLDEDRTDPDRDPACTCGAYLGQHIIACPAIVPEEHRTSRLAEPQHPGAVVVDGFGDCWVRDISGEWCGEVSRGTWQDVMRKFPPLRLPTAAEKAEWNIPDTLPPGHVAVKVVHPAPLDGLAYTIRTLADDVRGDGWRFAADQINALADALDQEQGR